MQEPTRQRNPIHILLVEDDPEHVRTIWHMLHEKSDFEFRIEAVTRLSEAHTRLQGNSVDVILLDLSLISHQAEWDALRTIRQAAQQTALILITELQEEASGLAALEIGAQDYLLKEEIGTRVLVRALHYAVERQHYEHELRRANESLSTALDGAHLGMWDLDLTTGSARTNLRHNQIFGHPEGVPAWNRTTATQHMLPEDQPLFAEAYQRALATGEFDFTGRVRWPDDTVHWFHDRGHVYYDAEGQPLRIVGVTRDVTDQKEAEERLRQSEARQRFLLQLNDALLFLQDADEIKSAASRVLGTHLHTNRVYYSEFDADDQHITIPRDDYTSGAPSIAGRYPLSRFSQFTLRELRAGRPVVVADARTVQEDSEAERAAYAALQVGAFIVVPLIRHGRLVASLGATHSAPRVWTATDVELVRETAERTWSAVERARVEAMLRASEAKYRSLFETMDEGFCVIEKVENRDGEPSDFRYLIANPAFERHTNLRDVVGKTIRQLVPDVETPIIDRYDRVVRTGEPDRFEVYVARLDKWFSLLVFPAQSPGQIAVLLNNITERKRHERRQEFLLTLNDALRPLSDPLEIQRAAARVLGEHLQADRVMYREIDLDGQNYVVTDNYVRDDFPKHVGRFSTGPFSTTVQTLSRGETYVVDDMANAPELSDAEKKAYAALNVSSLVAVPLLKEGHWVVSLSVHCRRPRRWTQDDVAVLQETAERTAAVEHARAETALRSSEAMLQKALAIDTVGVLFFTLNGRIVGANSAFARMTGYTVAELQAAPHWEALTASEFLPVTARAADDLAARGETRPYEKQLIRPDGSRWWGLFAPTRLRGSGRGSLCVEFVLDITNQKRLEIERGELLEREQHARRLAEQAVDTQRVFLGMISHELRTPLSSIKGFSSSLLATDITYSPEQTREFLQIIEQEADTLAELIDQLLDMVRLQTGTLPVIPQQDELAAIIERARPQLETLSAGRQLIIDLAPDLPPVLADRRRIAQVVANLVSNAAKFSPPQTPIVIAARPHEGSVEISVTDEGSGIPSSERDRVFEAFHQIQTEAGHKPGAGLGLPICKGIIEAHGGAIQVDDRPGPGTTITFTLPVAVSASV